LEQQSRAAASRAAERPQDHVPPPDVVQPNIAEIGKACVNESGMAILTLTPRAVRRNV
jgi:hypothetical protein